MKCPIKQPEHTRPIGLVGPEREGQHNSTTSKKNNSNQHYTHPNNRMSLGRPGQVKVLGRFFFFFSPSPTLSESGIAPHQSVLEFNAEHGLCAFSSAQLFSQGHNQHFHLTLRGAQTLEETSAFVSRLSLLSIYIHLLCVADCSVFGFTDGDWKSPMDAKVLWRKLIHSTSCLACNLSSFPL